MTNSIQNDSKLHIEFESGIKMKNNDDTICGVQFVSDRRFDSHLTQFLKVLHMTNSILNDCKLCIEFESGIKRKNHGDAKSGINICLKNQNLSLDQHQGNKEKYLPLKCHSQSWTLSQNLITLRFFHWFYIYLVIF